MARFKLVSSAQTLMVPIILEKQLVPGTLEFAIHHLIVMRIVCPFIAITAWSTPDHHTIAEFISSNSKKRLCFFLGNML